MVDQFLVRNKHVAARDQLNLLLASEPKNTPALMRVIDVHIALRESVEALQRARELLMLAPANLDAQFYLAKAEYAGGNFSQSAALIEQLLATAATDSPALHLLRGNVFLSQHAFAQATLAFEQASVLDGNSATAFAGLGIARRRQGNEEAARQALSLAIALAPGDSVALTELAHSYRTSGAVADAEACFERALTISPDVVATWFDLGQLLAETFKFERAKQCFERALALQPVNKEAHTSTHQSALEPAVEHAHEQTISTLGFVLAEMGETEAALKILTSDADKPADVLNTPHISLPRQVRSLLLLPQIYSSTDDLQRWRQRFSSGLEVLRSAAQDAADIWQVAQSNFLLAYQGLNDRDMQAAYAGFLRALMLKRRPDLLELPKLIGPIKGKIAGGRKRIRVVFVSSFFRECTVGHYFRSWIADLDAQVFERIVIHTGWQPDEFGRVLQTQCDEFILARGGVLSAAEVIRAQAADIVIYPEVGMGTMNYLLTNMRLATIQIAGWGHPITTGSQEIDYFLTCEDMEPLGESPGEFMAAAHYTERLLMLPGIGTRYIMPAIKNSSITRETFGLSSGSHVYICPQSLFKIHPDNDAIYLDIMARDNKAIVLFFQSEHRAITQAFSQRLCSGLAARGMAPRSQIKFLPRLDAASFRAVLWFADVVLDTLHWSGGNTSLDALAAAAPIVTLPGEFMRGRQTQAMLGAMDLEELVVADQEAYVSKALEVAGDPGVRAALSDKISMNRGAVFDRREPVTQLAQHLLRLFETRSP